MTVDAELPITSVRVFEDRAQVTRRGSVHLESGSNTIVVSGVSPLLVERTLDVKVGGGAADGARTRRWLDTDVRDRLADDPELLEQFEVATDRARRAANDVERRRAHVDRLTEIRAQWLGELAVAANETPFDETEAEQVLQQLGDAERAARFDLVDADTEHRAARRDLGDLEARMRANAGLGSVWRAALDIDAARAEPGPVEVEVSYVVANAAWRPAHVATRAAGAATVTVRSEAVVWQATDEPWDDVRLVLSTARTRTRTDPPALEDDVLALVETGRDVDIDTYEIDDALGETPTFDRLPGVDDGGVPQQLEADGTVKVGADGLPTRVPIGAFTADTVSDLVCRPELEAVVHRRTRQVNGRSHPLLAGPVLLVEDGGVIGWTTTDHVGPGEQFELSWGPEVAVTVDRRVELRDDASITGATDTLHRVHVQLTNTGAADAVVEVVERVPVSEIDRVKVTIDETSPAAAPDDDGLVRWSVGLGPNGASSAVVLGFTVRKHRTVTG
jgi:hypothetical protein